MMYKKKTSLAHRLGALLMVPAIAAGCALTAIPAVAGVLESFADVSISAPAEDKKIYTSVDETAEYADGGMQGLMRFLMNNIRYPEEAYKNDIQGRVIVKFVIEKDGSIADAQVIKGVDPQLDKEALRVVNAMPAWIPGKVKGEPVASCFTLPVTFKLQSQPDTPEKTENK